MVAVALDQSICSFFTACVDPPPNNPHNLLLLLVTAAEMSTARITAAVWQLGLLIFFTKCCTSLKFLNNLDVQNLVNNCAS